MNWRLVFMLSLFGLVMSVATVFVIRANIEPVFWLVIFVYCAYMIARGGTGRFFLHGFMVSIFNCVWITAGHIIFLNSYLSTHPNEAAMMQNMPMPDSPALMMLMVGPVVGIISGIVLGLFSFIASKIVKRKAATA
jgi:hypothetical protein